MGNGAEIFNITVVCKYREKPDKTDVAKVKPQQDVDYILLLETGVMMIG
jgi:hypothetical protein